MKSLIRLGALLLLSSILNSCGLPMAVARTTAKLPSTAVSAVSTATSSVY